MAEERFDHKLPFNVDGLMPRFPYRSHSAWDQLLFALISGVTLGGLLAVAYLFLF